MALVSCQECEAQISDRAVACPRCGAPVAAPPLPTVATASAGPPPSEAMVARVWEVPKSSIMGHTVTLAWVADELVRELQKTDIQVTDRHETGFSLSREAKAMVNQVGFQGEIRLSDAGDRIGVQLLGQKDLSKAVAGGLLNLCTAILVCPPILLCTGAKAAVERNYVERTIGSIITKLCAKLGTASPR